MGNYGEALQVILAKSKNVRKAVIHPIIHYVEKQKIHYDQLIDRMLTGAKALMPESLDAVKAHPFVDTEELIQKIPDNLNIHDLKSKITAIFDENLLEKSLTAGTTNMSRSDCMKLARGYKFESTKVVGVNFVGSKTSKHVVHSADHLRRFEKTSKSSRMIMYNWRCFYCCYCVIYSILKFTCFYVFLFKLLTVSPFV